jgi:hypothetical protein
VQIKGSKYTIFGTHHSQSPSVLNHPIVTSPPPSLKVIIYVILELICDSFDRVLKNLFGP